MCRIALLLEVSLHACSLPITANRLAQLFERRTTVREVAGWNPDRTKNQGLKIISKIMLAMIASLGGDVKPLALSPTFVSCSSRRGR